MLKRMIAMLLCAALLLGGAASAEGDWRNILLLGDDTRNFDDSERSDVMIIISVNEAKGKVKLTSIMRDTEVSYPNGGSGKINAAMNKGGPDYAVKTVNKNFGTDISEYIVINFQDLIKAVDLIGGVTVEIDEGEMEYINEKYTSFGVAKSFEPLTEHGLIRLNGAQALAHSRNRSSSPAGDYDRVVRQREVLIALLKELQEKDVNEVMALAPELIDLVTTNIADDELKRLGTTAMAMEVGEIEEFRLPASGAFQDGLFNGTWKIKPNLSKNQQMLKEFIYGTELKNGSSGTKVEKLQQKLLDMGLLNGKVDGVYGKITAAAVSAAQEKLGVKVTGTASDEFLELLYAQ